MKIFFSLAIVILYSFYATTLTMATTTAASTALLSKKEYLLQRLAITDGGATTVGEQSTSSNALLYLYEHPGDDAAQLYKATMRVMETTGREETTPGGECQGGETTGDVWLELALHITNRFRVKLCFTPVVQQQPDDQEGNGRNAILQSYKVKMVTPMMSTKMLAIDPDVQQLEKQWNQALPSVTAATLHSNGNLVLTSSSPHTTEIVLRPFTTEGAEGEGQK